MEERTKTSVKAIKVALAGNVVLALLKVSIGIIAESFALISDGLDSLVDIVKAFVVYKGTKIASVPVDIDHPYGHGRAETVSSGIIGMSVVFTGALVMTQSIINFGKTNAVDTLMFIGASISIIGKIVLSRYMAVIGKRVLNAAILANAKDYLGDVLSSFAVVIGAILIRMTGKVYFDSVASIAVATIIIYMGIGILKPAVKEVMEEQDSPELIEKVEEIVSLCKKAENPHHIRIRRLGSYYIVDMHIEFPKDMSVKEAHEVVSNLENKIKQEVKEISEVIIHIEPLGNG